MNKLLLAFLLSLMFFDNFALDARSSMSQPVQMRELCQKIQKLEKKIAKLRAETEQLSQKEKNFAPFIRNIYEIISRCFTLLFDIQRFSDLLVLTQIDDKNDFVKCSIVIKNFASYFKSVSSQLEKTSAEITKLKRNKKAKMQKLEASIAEYEKLSKDIEILAEKLAKTRVENTIQNDVVYHLATKSESLEELDAELEAENAIGVLKNTKVSTELTLAYPVVGKIVAEFGDKGANNEMIYYISFETCPGAIVTSPAKGLIVFSGKFLNYGNMLIISNGEYRVFLYGMDILFSSTGDVVEIGDYVGRMQEKTVDNPVIKMELKKSGEPLDPRHWLLETMDKKGKETQ